jgi:hypothetical protein
MTRTILLLSSTISIILCLNVGAQDQRIFPLRGIVSSPSNPGLMVRKTLPEISALSYQLAEPICAIGNGSEFIALEESYLANGEIWFRVYFSKESKRILPCPQEQPNGWMIAKSKDRWQVSVLEQKVTLPQPTNIAIAAQARQSGPLKSVGQPSSQIFLVKYILLIIGTMAGACIVAVERSKELHPRKWLSWFFAFELLVLSVVNVLTAALFIKEFFQVDSPDLTFRLLKVVQGSPGGYALLGFVLSVILLRFFSFAKHEPPIQVPPKQTSQSTASSDV